MNDKLNILVTGGSGFLGSHVADVLSDDGHRVTVFDLNESTYLKPNQKMFVGNVANAQAVFSAVQNADIDIVYHFAGMTDIDAAKKQPYETIQTNVMGTTTILEACRRHGVKRLVFASTIYVYSEGGSFYRASKQACELIIECYQKSFGVNFTILRYGSLYGPRANESNWVRQILQQAVSEKKMTRLGNGEEIREYIHVHDAARLSRKALSDQFKNQYVMITGQQPIQIRNLMIMIKEMLNQDVKLEFLNEENEQHYQITPYNFRPKVAKRIEEDSYIDLGQGVLDLIYSIADKKIN